MVLSASSVYSYRFNDGDSYAVVRRQLLWVLLGLPCAYVASRISMRWMRRLAYPAYLFSLALLLLTAFIGVTVNGNQNWLAFGPVQIQPAEIAKLGLVIWAAHVYANKDRRLDRLNEVMFPVVPGMLVATGAGHRRQGPRDGARPVRDPARDALGRRRPGAVLHAVPVDPRRRSRSCSPVSAPSG